MKIPFTTQVILLFCLWIFTFQDIGKSGDLPPRAGFAEKWHPQILQELPDIQLTLLIGQYAQAYYLQGESQWQGNRTGKTLPELLANLFSTGTPLTAKSNLDGQKSLV